VLLAQGHVQSDGCVVCGRTRCSSSVSVRSGRGRFELARQGTLAERLRAGGARDRGRFLHADRYGTQEPRGRRHARSTAGAACRARDSAATSRSSRRGRRPWGNLVSAGTSRNFNRCEAGRQDHGSLRSSSWGRVGGSIPITSTAIALRAADLPGHRLRATPIEQRTSGRGREDKPAMREELAMPRLTATRWIAGRRRARDGLRQPRHRHPQPGGQLMAPTA